MTVKELGFTCDFLKPAICGIVVAIYSFFDGKFAMTRWEATEFFASAFILMARKSTASLSDVLDLSRNERLRQTLLEIWRSVDSMDGLWSALAPSPNPVLSGDSSDTSSEGTLRVSATSVFGQIVREAAAAAERLEFSEAEDLFSAYSAAVAQLTGQEIKDTPAVSGKIPLLPSRSETSADGCLGYALFHDNSTGPLELLSQWRADAESTAVAQNQPAILKTLASERPRQVPISCDRVAEAARALAAGNSVRFMSGIGGNRTPDTISPDDVARTAQYGANVVAPIFEDVWPLWEERLKELIHGSAKEADQDTDRRGLSRTMDDLRRQYDLDPRHALDEALFVQAEIQASEARWEAAIATAERSVVTAVRNNDSSVATEVVTWILRASLSYMLQLSPIMGSFQSLRNCLGKRLGENSGAVAELDVVLLQATSTSPPDAERVLQAAARALRNYANGQSQSLLGPSNLQGEPILRQISHHCAFSELWGRYGQGEAAHAHANIAIHLLPLIVEDRASKVILTAELLQQIGIDYDETRRALALIGPESAATDLPDMHITRLLLEAVLNLKHGLLDRSEFIISQLDRYYGRMARSTRQRVSILKLRVALRSGNYTYAAESAYDTAIKETDAYFRIQHEIMGACAHYRERSFGLAANSAADLARRAKLAHYAPLVVEAVLVQAAAELSMCHAARTCTARAEAAAGVASSVRNIVPLALSTRRPHLIASAVSAWAESCLLQLRYDSAASSKMHFEIISLSAHIKESIHFVGRTMVDLQEGLSTLRHLQNSVEFWLANICGRKETALSENMFDLVGKDKGSIMVQANAANQTYNVDSVMTVLPLSQPIDPLLRRECTEEVNRITFKPSDYGPRPLIVLCHNSERDEADRTAIELEPGLSSPRPNESFEEPEDSGDSENKRRRESCSPAFSKRRSVDSRSEYE